MDVCALTQGSVSNFSDYNLTIVLYVHGAVLGYLKMSYGFWKSNSGLSKYQNNMATLELFWM